MNAPAAFDARRAFRVRDAGLLVALGGAIAIVAVLLTTLAAHNIGQNERSVTGLEARLDSLRSPRDAARDSIALAARIAEAEAALALARYHLDAAKEQRDNLWTWTGAATLLAALGGLLVGAGVATLRRARLARQPPPD
jgi:hypothetical protein